MNIAIIFNPIAGRMKHERLARAVAAFKAHGIVPRVRTTGKRGDACTIAREEAGKGGGIIIAAGGDGTINEVANGLVDSPARLGILPMGGANLFALEMQIPHHPAAAVDVILRGSAQQINAGYIQCIAEDGKQELSHYFLLMAGVGFDGGVLREIKRTQIARWGKAAYLMTGVRFLAHYTRAQLSIRVDRKETISASSAIVGKSRYYGGRKCLVTPHASPKDDYLDLCAFTHRGTITMMKYACAVLAGSHLRHAGIYYGKVQSLEMHSAEEVFVQADGDFLGRLPARLGVKKEALAVMVPPLDQHR